MKNHLKRLLLLCLTLAFTAASAWAGPFKTVVILGTANQSDFILAVPVGKAVTIQAFISNDAGTLSVTIDNLTSDVMAATFPSNQPNAVSKDVVIDGPATISVNVVNGKTAFLSYKVFAN